MLRRMTAGASAVAVLSGMVTVGAVMSAGPAAAADPVANNPVLQSCGIPVTLVLDASSSIDTNEQADVKTAAKAFLDGLDNTNSNARVIQFSGTSAQVIGRTNISSTTPAPPATSSLKTIKDAIDAKYHSNTLEVGSNPTGDQYIYPGTNWESALWFVNQPANELNNGLVVFITDGDPTRIGTTTSTSASNTVAADASIPRANALKALGNRVIAVGVGDEIGPASRDRLKLVSGPNLITSIPEGTTINGFDVLISETFAGLGDALQGVAKSLCGGAVTIQKFTDENPDGSYTPAGGWGITAKVNNATNPEDFTWIKPVNTTDEQVTGTTADAPQNPSDAPKGTVQFQYSPKATWNGKNPSLTITEALKQNFAPRTDFGYRCEFPGSRRTPVQGDMTVSGQNASFTIGNVTADEQVSCALYNTRAKATLRLKKTVVGGGTTSSQWIMTANGPTGSPSYSQPGDQQAFKPVWANAQYTLGETPPNGEADNYVPGTWSCDKEVGVTNGNVTIPIGTTEVTCEITNTRKGTITVEKQTDPNGSTKEFTFTPGGWNDNTVFDLADNQTKTSEPLVPGDGYSVEEEVPQGWDQGQVTCTGGQDPANITVVAGQDVKCTFNNTQRGTITVEKQTDPDGSTEKFTFFPGGWNQDKSFTLADNDTKTSEPLVAGLRYSVEEGKLPSGWDPGQVVCTDGQDPKFILVRAGRDVKCTFNNVQRGTITVEKQTDPDGSPQEFTFSPGGWNQDQSFTLADNGTKTSEPLVPDTGYFVQEEVPEGWDQGQVTCSGGQNPANIRVLAGQDVKCTFNNTQRGTITVEKQTDPNGSTKKFTFTPGGWNDNTVFDLADNQTKTSEPLVPGDGYSVEEEVPQGWDQGQVTCSGGQNPANITVVAGQDVKCTFNNTQRGTIIVKKVTEPAGDTEAQFTFDPSWSDKNFTLENGGSEESKPLVPGTYSVSEEEIPFGWELKDAQCTGGNTPDEIDLGAGQTVTCTFTNVKQTALLRLQKEVDGGSATKADWLLSALADAPFDGKNIKDVPGDNTEWATVYADVLYSLSESEGPANYTPGTSWDCRPDNLAEGRPTFTQDGNQVRLDPGDKVTCTIVNTRDLAELKLVKQVSGGKANANEFTLSAEADAPDNDLNFSNKGGSGDFNQVYAETEYTLSETGPAGYSRGQWVCEGSEVRPQFAQSGDTITLDKGERVTCTIVNTRDLGSLTISKEFNAQTSGFTGTFDINYTCVDGADPVKSGTVKLANGQSETISGLPTGTTCTVTEPTLPAPPAGWQFNPASFVPANGQVTVTAKDQSVSVQVVNSITQVNPVVNKKVCPIEPVLVKKIKKDGNRVLIKKIKTKKSSCVLLKPVVLCRPLGATAAGETAFCDTRVTKRGRVVVNTKGYDRVRVTVVVRSKPKPGFEDRWKPNTWRKSWILKG